MHLLADENVSRNAIEALRGLGHDVSWVATDAPGISDEAVLARASAEGRVLVTADKDFGELAFRWGLPAASSIILLRSRGTAALRTASLVAAVETREDWTGQFAVVENDRVRVTALPSSD